MRITDANQLLELEENKFEGSLPKLTNTQINFNGKNNILVCEEGVHLWNSRIDFNMDNSILYLSSNIHDYSVNISIHADSSCFIGKDNFFNGQTTMVLSEAKNIVIGSGCFFSYNVIFRVSDGHAIYSTDSYDRMNFSKSIYVGDHVWLGQNAMVFKGSQIGSGTIIGAGSVVSNKTIPSNTTCAGAPLRLIKKGTFWTPHSVHGWGEKEIAKMSKSKSDLFTYNKDKSNMSFDEIENTLNSKSPGEVLEFFRKNFLNENKNRFFVENYLKSENPKHGKLSRFLNR